MKYSRFEDLPIWKDARVLTKEVYEVTKKGEFAKDYRLKNQIRDSSVSIMSNIAEGFENQTTKQFIRYLYIAKGSSGEFRSQLYVAMDAGYLTQFEINKMKSQAESISKQASNLIKYLDEYQNSDKVREHDDLCTILYEIERWKD
jgi:four helix bundle protein